MVPEAPLEQTDEGLVAAGDGWFALNAGYTVDAAALRHGAGVEQETTDAEQAYARFPTPVPSRYRDGSLPG